METKSLDFEKLFNNVFEEAFKERGIVNILIAGKTGVGKSTLINSIFQGNLAETGQGKPVTQEIRKITKTGIPLSIYDSKGLELKNFKEIISDLENFLDKQNYSTNPNDHVHLAYLCISEESRRVENAEIDLAKSLKKKNIPFIVVISKATSDNGFKNILKNEIPDASNWVRVNSVKTILDNGMEINPSGLEKLVEATMEIVPEGQRKAFIASQKVSIELKVKESNIVVSLAAAAAAAAGASPIPFSDFPLIIGIQVTMLAKISATFGLKTEEGILYTLISTMITGSGATLAGRAIVANLLKLFPVVGSVVGGAISGATAAALTTAFGLTYIKVLEKLYTKDPDLSNVDSKILKKLFLDEFKASKE